MTARGVAFLENWIAKNIASDAKPEDSAVLAARCISDAAALSISQEEMNGEWGAS